MKVMLVILVMQVMQVSQVMQVLRVSGAHLWVDFWVIFNISNNIYNFREDILISWSNIDQVYETEVSEGGPFWKAHPVTKP